MREQQVDARAVPDKLRYVTMRPKARINDKEKSGEAFLNGKALSVKLTLGCSVALLFEMPGQRTFSFSYPVDNLYLSWSGLLLFIIITSGNYISISQVIVCIRPTGASLLKCKFLGPKPEFSVWRLETCILKATLNDCFVQESFRIRVWSLLVARDRNSVQSSLSIKGLYACGIKKGKGMSLPSGEVWFGDQITTSFTLLPVGWLDCWDPHPGLQELQTCHYSSLMNIKTSPRSHSFICLY